MKKSIITTLLALVALTGQAQVSPTTALLGSWSGKLKVGAASQTIVLHLEQADGFVKVSLAYDDKRRARSETSADTKAALSL